MRATKTVIDPPINASAKNAQETTSVWTAERAVIFLPRGRIKHCYLTGLGTVLVIERNET